MVDGACLVFCWGAQDGGAGFVFRMAVLALCSTGVFKMAVLALCFAGVFKMAVLALCSASCRCWPCVLMVDGAGFVVLLVDGAGFVVCCSTVLTLCSAGWRC